MKYFFSSFVTFQPNQCKYIPGFNMRIYWFFLIICVSFATYAQNEVSLKGNFPGAEGRTLRVFHYADQITYLKKEIDRQVIDSLGDFSFTLRLNATENIFFRIDHARMHMFVTPGEEYFLQFDPVDFSEMKDQGNPYIDPWYFSFDILKPKDDLNARISNFDDRFHDFLSENFVRMQKSRNFRMLDQFRVQMDSVFGDITDPFFMNYYTYKFAYYYRVSGSISPVRQIETYILNEDILYNNTQYMNFFNAVFASYIFAGSRSLQYGDLTYTINQLNSYNALMDSLGKDTILRNELLRELVLLNGLNEIYGKNEFNKQNVKSILHHINENSKFFRHREIAGNILHQKTYLSEGSPAPSFELSNSEKNKVNIPDDFMGKFLLLSFGTSNCQSCIIESYAMDELAEKYKDQFAFLTIMTDRHEKDFLDYVQAHKFGWPHLYFNHRFDLLDDYRIRAVPFFVLISPEGDILRYPAPYPSKELINTFDYLLFQKRRNNQQ